VRTYLPAALLGATIAWCTATGGAVDPLEMIVAATLVLAAWLTSSRPNQTRRSRSDSLGLALVVALIVWLIVDGPMRVGLDIEAVRVPFLVLLVVLAASTVSRLEGRQIEAVLLAAVTVGIVQAGLAVVGSVVQLPAVVQGQDFHRPTSLVGNPNALAVILVATGCLTLRAAIRRSSAWLVGGLVLQAVAVLLTGSRLAIGVALCVVAVYGLRSGSLRVKKLLLAWGLLAVAVFALRVASSPPNPRPELWAAALSRLSEHPLIGNGPVLQIYFAHPPRQATTHAHNELLQFAVDYGLIGLTLGLAALATVVSRLAAGRRADPWVAAAGVTLCASGLADYGLRITAIALLGSVTLAAACRAAQRVNSDIATTQQPDPDRSQPPLSRGLCVVPLRGRRDGILRAQRH
jgi:O-antigen ligase